MPVNSVSILPASVSRAKWRRRFRGGRRALRPRPTGTEIRLPASDLSDDGRPNGSARGPSSLRRRIHLDAKNNYFGWRSLLGQEPGSAGVSPYAAAASAADVSGLPPTYISVGGLDLFLEENLTYADRLSRAGVPVEFHLYPRAYHGFYCVTNARVTRKAEHDTREALRRFLHG